MNRSIIINYYRLTSRHEIKNFVNKFAKISVFRNIETDNPANCLPNNHLIESIYLDLTITKKLTTENSTDLCTQRTTTIIHKSNRWLKTSDSLIGTQNETSNSLINPIFFFIKGSNKNDFIKISLHNVIYIEAMLNYIKIIDKNAVHITYLTLKAIEYRLRTNGSFIRISKSIIINIFYISLVKGNQVIMENGVKLNIGPSYRDKFKSYISQHRLE